MHTPQMFPKQNKSARGPVGIFPVLRVLGHPFSSGDPDTCFCSLSDGRNSVSGSSEGGERGVLAKGNEGVSKLSQNLFSEL